MHRVGYSLSAVYVVRWQVGWASTRGCLRIPHARDVAVAGATRK